MRKIVWQRWKCPLNSHFKKPPEPVGWDEDDDSDDDSFNSPIMGSMPLKVMHTPFGMITPAAHSFAVEQIDLWMMHTNFDIDDDIVKLIKKTRGVETLEIYSRYRARVGFPKYFTSDEAPLILPDKKKSVQLFDSKETMQRIEDAMEELDKSQQDELLEKLPEDVGQRIKQIRDALYGERDNWTILVLPNGNCEVIASAEDDKEYQDKLQPLIDTCEEVGGFILNSQ